MSEDENAEKRLSQDGCQAIDADRLVRVGPFGVGVVNLLSEGYILNIDLCNHMIFYDLFIRAPENVRTCVFLIV